MAVPKMLCSKTDVISKHCISHLEKLTREVNQKNLVHVKQKKSRLDVNRNSPAWWSNVNDFIVRRSQEKKNIQKKRVLALLSFLTPLAGCRRAMCFCNRIVVFFSLYLSFQSFLLYSQGSFYIFLISKFLPKVKIFFTFFCVLQESFIVLPITFTFSSLTSHRTVI